MTNLQYSFLLKQYMQSIGVDYMGVVDFNYFKIQRFKLADGSRLDPRVWVYVHADGEGATFGNWGESDEPLGHWFANQNTCLSYPERKKRNLQIIDSTHKRLVEAHNERDKSYAKCLYQSQYMVQASASHPYLVKKQLSNEGVMFYDGELLFPMNDVDGYFKTFHRIMPDGSKKLSWALSPDGGFVHLGAGVTSPIRVCEGWATGKAILEAVGGTVMCAIPCGNVPKVVKSLVNAYPAMEIIICPDNDQWKAKELDVRTGKFKKNAGMYYANIAALEFDLEIIAPNFSGLDVSSKPTDWHDLKMLAGSKEVRKQLLKE